MKEIMKSFAYLIYYIVFQFVIMSGITAFLAISGRITSESGVENFVNNNVLGLTIVSNLLTVFILFVFFFIRKKKFAEEINLKKVELKKCVFPSAMAFFYATAFALITYHANFENAGQIQKSAAYYSSFVPSLGIVVQIMALLIISPITEEIIFRGLILTRLQRRFQNLIAILFSGLLFGIIHATAGGMTLIVGAAIMGSIFGVICVKTGSLMPAVIAHSIANIPDFILALLPELPDGVRYVLLVSFLLVFAIMMYLFVGKDFKGYKSGLEKIES